MTLGGYNLAEYARKGAGEGDITWSNVASDEKTWSVNFNGA